MLNMPYITYYISYIGTGHWGPFFKRVSTIPVFRPMGRVRTGEIFFCFFLEDGMLHDHNKTVE